MRIGVLALQGAFAAHAQALTRLGHEVETVRSVEGLARSEGLVLPGGESTTQRRLLQAAGLEGALRDFLHSERPVLATCAGLILCAERLEREPAAGLGPLDVTVARNAYGPQLESFEARDDAGRWPLVFIRAPRIASVGPRAEVIARLEGEPIGVRQGALYGLAWHPELTEDLSLHAQVFGRA